MDTATRSDSFVSHFFNLLRYHPCFFLLVFTLSICFLSPAVRAENPAVDYNGGAVTDTLQKDAWRYYNVVIPAHSEGFKVTLSHTGSNNPDLYIKENADPTTTSYYKKSLDADEDVIILTNTTNANRTYHIGVYLPSDEAGATTFTLETHGEFYESVLNWDDGSSLAGTSVLNLSSPNGGQYYFKVVTSAPVLDVWRAALTVTAGEANLYAKKGTIPTTTSATESSENVGDDGFTRQLSQSTGAGQIWYLLIDTQADTECKIVVGDIYVEDLGALAASNSAASSALTEQNIPPEGARFYKTTLPSETLAWKLWLKDGTNTSTWDHDFYVRKGLAPFSSVGNFDKLRVGQALFVPTYITPGSGEFYYIGIWGDPNETFTLDSQQQEIIDIAFDSSDTDGIVISSNDGFHYKTFRVSVPEEQIAWDVSIQPTTGDPHLCLRRNNVPNPLNNDAFSEVVSPTVTDSFSLTPPFLSNGVFYLTTYSDANYSGKLRNNPPVVTPIEYATASLEPNNPAHHFYSIVNDAAHQNRAGWRYYAVTDNGEPQLSSLGWLLQLENQVADTKIAIRRNYVPSGRSYRENGRPTIKTVNYDDVSSSFGSLQHRNHVSDIWYIGIYMPTAPLGAFTLKSGHEYADIISMDGSGSTVNLTANAWTFYRVDVPSQINGNDVLGWEVKVPSWQGDIRPEMMIRRNALPADTRSTPSSIKSSTEWLIGSQWASYDEDWTHRPFSPDGSQESESFGLSMAMGQPLEVGTYYIGFYNPSQTESLEFTFTSKAIGANLALSPVALGFKAGDTVANTASITDLPARDIKYFYVDVPANTTSWRVSLTNDSGESSLYLRESWIPTSEATSKDGSPNAPPYSTDYNDRTKATNLVKLQKEGGEHYTLMPKKPNTTDLESGKFIPAGRYYLMVVSEGVVPTGEYYTQPDNIGVGNASSTLTSHGEASVRDLGTLSVNQNLTHVDSYVSGGIQQYTFSVGVDVKALQVTLTDRLGNPTIYALHLEGDSGFPSGGGYGYYSGRLLTSNPYKLNGSFSPSTVTLNNTPSGSIWRLTIMDSEVADSVSDGSYTLNIITVGETILPFDRSQVNSVTDHAPQTWQFYKVIVPETISSQDVLGWELKLQSWTSDDGTRPEMVIRRDLLPSDTKTTPSTLKTELVWSSGAQWTSYDEDWTHRTFNSDGSQDSESFGLTFAMGQPLEAGTYYIGFFNPSEDSSCNYTFTSKGIGEGMEHSPQPLGFQSGGALANSATITNLPARQVKYFYVDIPSDTPSWRVSLSADAGESSLYLRQSWIPTSQITSKDGLANQAPYAWLDDVAEPYSKNQARLQKQGDEHYTLFPKEGEIVIPTGRYYLMVVSEGVVADPSTTSNSKWIGVGNSTSTLTSHGAIPILDIGTLPAEGEVTKTASYTKGRVNHHSFTIPDGVKSLEVHLENRVGDPWVYALYMSAEPLIFGSAGAYGYHSGYKLSDYGGEYSNSLITLNNPEPGSIVTLVVMDPSTDVDRSSPLADGAYNLRIKTVGEKEVDFNSGAETVTDQSPGTWSFYKVVVPAQVNGKNVLGWEVKLTDWSGANESAGTGRPKMFIRRDVLPTDDRTTSGLQRGTEWPSGAQWLSTYRDWTGRRYSADGTQNYEGYGLTFAMGQPLEAGTYYVGFYNDSSSPCSYSFTSRGVGEGLSLDPQPLSFNGGAVNITDLPARQVKYFYVDVPAETPSWKVSLGTNSGESSLYIRQSWIPTSEAASSDGSPIVYPYDSDYRDVSKTTNLVKLRKNGDEFYTLLPKRYNTSDIDSGKYLPTGRYFLMVVSEGQSPSSTTRIGTGNSSSTLTSTGQAPIHALGTLPVGGQLTLDESFQSGDLDLVEFTIPLNTLAFEVALEDRAGNPIAQLEWINTDTEDRVRFPKAGFYGYFSSETADLKNFTRTTLANPSEGLYRLVISDTAALSSIAQGSYRLVITSKTPSPLNFTETENTNGDSHQATGSLADNERDFYEVAVPSMLADNSTGAVIIGWKLEITSTSGQPEMRVQSELLPEDTQASGGTLTRWAPHSIIIAPPELNTGTWFVEVKGVGAASEYTITSTPITLEREVWMMPRPGETTATPGLTAPQFGDTGIDALGGSIGGDDQGTDLENGNYHFYAFEIPEENGGLIRAKLNAISGNPDLYIRYGGVPTIDHNSPPFGSKARALFNYRLEANEKTEYGNFVPADGKLESELQPGLWYLAVRASGGTNARYRLELSRGYVEGLPADSVDIENAPDQLLNSGDFFYYRVVIPDDAKLQWHVTYSVSRGDVDLIIRDSIPAGDYLKLGSSGGVSTYIADWYKERKNNLVPKTFNPVKPGDFGPGTYTFTYPALRAGSVYYIGFRATSDATFKVQSSLVSDASLPGIQAVAFKGGAISSDILAGEIYYYKVEVPSIALKWVHSATRNREVEIRIEQGSLPSFAGLNDAHYVNKTSSTLSKDLSVWPWVPDQTYYIGIKNNGTGDEHIEFTMDGETAKTYAEWAVENSIPVDPALASQDNNGNGVIDLIEYSLEPLSYPAAGMIMTEIITNDDGSLSLRFTTPEEVRSGKTIKIQVSPDLAAGNWQTIASKEGMGKWVGTTNIKETVKRNNPTEVIIDYPASYSAANKGFIRVLVELE